MNFFRRSAVASSSDTMSPNSVMNDFPEALTYRYNDYCVWVPAAKTHEEAIDLAKQAYPELRNVHSDRITFHTTGESSIVGISPAAWQLIVRRLPQYHIVDVKIRDTEELEGDAEPPKYPYMSTTLYTTIPREKEETYLQ